MTQRQQRVLIVDDEESIRRSLRAYLEDEGFDVVATGTGEEGLVTLSHEGVDVAIVDMRLPGMDGNAFIERAHHMCPGMTFFIYTGSVGYKVPFTLEAIGVGADHVFKKPLADMSLLVEAMRRLLEARRGQ